MIRGYYICPKCKWETCRGNVEWGVVELEQVPVETISPIYPCCSECGRPFDVNIAEEKYYCPVCGCILDLVSKNERTGETFNISGRDYSQPLISDSLAINPDQIAEHREKFPDITVHADGRLQFENFRQHDNYLKKTGFNKMTQRRKSVGKTLGGKVVAKENRRTGKVEFYD